MPVQAPWPAPSLVEQRTCRGTTPDAGTVTVEGSRSRIAGAFGLVWKRASVSCALGAPEASSAAAYLAMLLRGQSGL